MDTVWNSFTEYIIDNYSQSNLIIEVGVGKILEPSNILNKELTNTVIKRTDIYPCDDTVIKDDITNPNYRIYENADLIYSIRPPEELQKYIMEVSKKVNCDCIIKPFFTEELSNNLKPRFKLVNYKRDVFYHMKKFNY